MIGSCIKTVQGNLLKKFGIFAIAVLMQMMILFSTGCTNLSLEMVATEPTPYALSNNAGTVFLTDEGDVYTMGKDWNPGRYVTILGQGEGVTRSEVPVKILSDVVKIQTCMALKANGELWVWGNNQYYEIGLPEEKIVYVPTLLMSNVVDFDYNCALKSNGELWGWSYTAYRSPTSGEVDPTPAIKIADGVKAFYKNKFGFNYSCFLKQDNSLWGFGNYYYTGEYLTEPKKLAEDVITCSANEQVMYIKSDGSLWGFGNNEFGQVGTGEHGDFDTKTYDCIVNEPVKIMDHVAEVYTDPRYTFVITEDRTLWGWGRNQANILCTDNKIEPSPIRIAENVKRVDIGGYYIDYNDTLWGWGPMPVGDGQGFPLAITVPYCKAANDLRENSVTSVKKPMKVLENVECLVGFTSDYRIVLAKNGTYYHWGLPQTDVKTYGEANVIVFCTFKADGTQDMVTGVWSSLFDTGYTGELGTPDEEIVGGIGYVYSQILTPEPCEFPG